MTGLLLLVLSATPAAVRCQHLEAQAMGADPTALRGLLAALPHPVLEDGRPGSLPAIAAAMDALQRAPEESVAAARETLHATCLQLAADAASPARIDGRVLGEILAQPELAGRTGQAWALERLLARALDILKDLLQQRGFHDFSLVGRDVFLAAVLGLLLVGGWRVLRKQRALSPAQPGPLDSGARVERVPDAELLGAQARTALASGQAREALRLEMRALVVSVGALGLIDVRGAATNRELARALASRAPALAEDAQSLAARFDGAVYGEAPIEIGVAGRFLDDALRLRRALQPR